MKESYEMQYEDFPQSGLVLIRPTSSDYESLVSRIKARSSKTPAESEGDDPHMKDDPGKSVVFSNESKKAIAFAQILWRFAFRDGREIAGSCAWAGAEVLLFPFGVPSDAKPAMRYRWAILPGSKRYVTNTGQVIGDNTDVRPPADQEVFKYGGVEGFGGGYIEPREPTRLSISIEGAFFEDGEFVGADRTKLFEQITGKATARAKIIEMASRKTVSADVILDEIQKSAALLRNVAKPRLLPDANTPASVYEDVAFRGMANQLMVIRKDHGDSSALETIRLWAGAAGPSFRKTVTAARI